MLQWTWGYINLFELVFSFPSGKCPEVEWLDYMVILFLIFWGTSILLFIVVAPIYISHQQCTRGSLFSTSLPILVIHYLLDNRHSNRCEVLSHCGVFLLLLFLLFLVKPLSLFFLNLFLISLLEYNCFTMVCYFLLYNKVNQLWFAFPWWLVILSTFSSTPWPSIYMCFFGKMSIWIFCPFFNWVCFLICSISGIWQNDSKVHLEY